MEKQAKKPSNRPKKYEEKVVIKGDFNEIMGNCIKDAKKFVNEVKKKKS